MFALRKDGTLLDYVEQVNYIKVHEDGFYILCNQEEAQGISLDGEIYSITENSIEGKDLITITEVNIRELAKKQEQELLSVNTELNNTQLALCGLYETIITLTEV